jgi:hypothetical protein
MLNNEDDRQTYRSGCRKLPVSRAQTLSLPLARSAPGVACTSKYVPCRGVTGVGVLTTVFSFASGEPVERPGGVV